MAQKGIGRLVQFGIAKETVRGTPETAATYWIPWNELSIEEKHQDVVDEQSKGIIEDSIGKSIAKEWAELNLKAPIADKHFGLILYAALGSKAVATRAGESIVYDHTITVAQSAQHQALSFFVDDPLAAQDYKHGLGMIESLEINYELGKFLDYTLALRGKKGATATLTPATTAENRFLSKHATFKIAGGYNGLNAQTFTVTIATPAVFTATAHELAAGDKIRLTTTGALPTGLAIATDYYVISAGLTANAFRVSLTYGGAAVNTSGTQSGVHTFEIQATSIKSLRLKISKNIEDDDALGNSGPADIVNKQFTIEGTLEATYKDESDFKTAYLAATAKALRIDLKNTDVTIGTATNPQVQISLAKVTFTELTKPFRLNDLVYQTVSFKAHYSTTNSLMISALVTNLEASY